VPEALQGAEVQRVVLVRQAGRQRQARPQGGAKAQEDGMVGDHGVGMRAGCGDGESGSVDGPPPWRGPWLLSQLARVRSNGLRVLSTFSGGGGSSMGYKLAGYKVIGAVEMDKGMADTYSRNLSGTPVFVETVAEFAKRDESTLPEGAASFDVLDGSPPCSVFSMAGNREKKWGSAHMFREGAAVQRLDMLFFDLIDLAGRLRPRVVVAENVKGIVIGDAKGYALDVIDAFSDIGYDCQVFLLNSALMGVPQRRKRVFFVARRSDLGLPKLTLSFNEAIITASEAIAGVPPPARHRWLSATLKGLWALTPHGSSLSKAHPKGSLFNWMKAAPDRPFPTLTARSSSIPLHWVEPRKLSDAECARAQTFPDDYTFISPPGYYVCGMSVPPRMLQRLSLRIAQWLGA
jgi:DNA (cytosine-5)-methyltransferase 1